MGRGSEAVKPQPALKHFLNFMTLILRGNIMKTVLSTALIAFTLASAAQMASAADVGGNVKTNVKAGVVLQMNTGIANKNEAALGSITGKSTSVGGNFKSRVKTAAIIQTNKGIANKNELALGSVTD
jgi:hypothetical protein